MAFISINNGFFNTKAIYQGKQLLFKSAIRKPIFEHDQTINVLGKDYVVGEGEHDIELNKTSNITQIACIKQVLSECRVSDINVISAMPINSYINKTARRDYELMIKGMEEVNKCIVYMEGIAAMFYDYNWYKGKLVCLIDIGGLTINAMLIDDCKMIPGTAFSIQMGTIILNSKIRGAIEQSSLCNVPNYQLKYLKDLPITKNIVAEYMGEIKQQLKQHQYPSNVIYRFIGGGSEEFKGIIRNEFRDAYISEYALWENVLGLNVIGGMLYEENAIH